MAENAASLTERFSSYFDREIAQSAAKSLGNGAEIEFHVADEIFTFTKVSGKNAVLPGPAKSPQIIFHVPPAAAESILAHPSENAGEIGIHIAKLAVSKDPELRVAVKFKAGFLGLLTKGYFGVLTAGGGQFASHLASHGLNGMGAIKSFLGKMKE